MIRYGVFIHLVSEGERDISLTCVSADVGLGWFSAVETFIRFVFSRWPRIGKSNVEYEPRC